MLVVVIVIVAGLVSWVTSKNQNGDNAASNLGTITPKGSGEVRRELSPAMQEKQDRVFAEEAEAARKRGASYIPHEGSLGPAAPIETAQPPQLSMAAEVGQPTMRRMSGGSGSSQNSQDLTGLSRQVERIVAGMNIRGVPVLAFAQEEPSPGTSGDGAGGSSARPSTAAAAANSSAGTTSSRGPDLTQGIEIAPAELLSPIDTDKTDEATARITGGPLAGATLIGKLVVFEEDFSIGFTSLRFGGKYYQVQAVGLNEQTASRAMGADVDHRYFDRYVMPILSAGLWGGSTYFTERGRTATQYVPSTGLGGEIVVSNDKASKEEAKNTAIGETAKKAEQIMDGEIQRRASKKNRMTLPQFTPLGIRFEQPIYAKDAK
jgi:intracellular multiplication protein IcmE